jgi:hypothetical protein
MDIIEMIEKSLQKIDDERIEKIICSQLPIYNGVCINCGRVFEINYLHPLYKKAEERIYLDALPVQYCKMCKSSSNFEIVYDGSEEF